MYFPIALLTLLAVGTHCVDFPACAQTCQSDAAAQTGGNTDASFVCNSSDFLNLAEACENANCSASDLALVFTGAVQFCEPVGGSIHIALYNLSSCAQPGLSTAKGQSGCSDTDWTCICASDAFTVGAAQYEKQHCSTADQQADYNFASAACAAVGDPLPPSTSNSSTVTSSAAY